MVMCFIFERCFTLQQYLTIKIMTKTNDGHTHFGKDSIYSHPQNKVDNFQFNQKVVDVFPDMINRSVPSYQNITDGIGKLASLVCPDKPVIYDLGCSLGNISLSIARHTSHKSPKIIGIDNSDAMLERCRQHVRTFNFGKFISLQQADLSNVNMQKCDMAVINFTLQFIQPDARQSVLNKIFAALTNNACLVISEKINESDQVLNNLLVDLHHDFKKENGYSDLEISQKRSALENVMKLDTVATHKQRLHKAGFNKVMLWYQHFNFVSLIAIK